MFSCSCSSPALAADAAAADANGVDEDEVVEANETMVEALHLKYLRHLVKSVEYWSGSWMMETARLA